jgi:hypothetical protein
MPPTKKRKGLPKKAKKKSSLLFDFLNDITWDKKNILNSENKHGYSRFMITKFLSMHSPYLPIVDVYLNRFQASMGDEEFHKLCLAIFPKKKVYLKYVGGKPTKDECKTQLKYIIDYFEVSEDEAFEYYEIAGDELITNIKMMYGIME